MNTIKFNPLDGVERDTQKVADFSLRDYDGELDSLSQECGNFTKIFSHAVLHIFITNKCNCDCTFCMNKKERICVCEDIDNSEYLARLEDVLDRLSYIKPYVIITGGEPTLQVDKVKGVLSVLKKYDYLVRTFSTNGYQLDSEVLNLLKEYNVTKNINISRHAISDDKNKEIMKGFPVDNEQILKIFNNSAEIGVEPRLSCLLQEKGVSNIEQIFEFIDYFKGLKCNNFLFREDIYDGRNLVKNIEKAISNHDNFTYIEKIIGLNYDVNVYHYKDKYSVKIYHDKKIDKDIVKDFVFLPNGKFMINQF